MREFRRWLKRAALWLFGIVAVLALLLFILRAYLNQVGTKELVQATARLDREDAGWTLEAIELAREKAAPPPEQNSAPLVLKAADLIDSQRNKEWSTWRNSEPWTVRIISPHLPDEQFRAGLSEHKEPTAEARKIAREIRGFSRGQHALIMQRNPYMTLLPHAQKAREVTALLEYDALLAALDNDAEGGIDASLAALNVGRSISDEPFLISQLVRLACTRISIQSAMQVLAWGEPRKGLAELQAVYRAEADVPFLLNGLRGERAVLHKVFAGLESGEMTFSDLMIHGVQKDGPAQQAAFYLYKGLLPGDHAKALEVLSAYIAAAKLPPHDFRYIVTRLVIPACGKVAMAALRTRAELLAASTLIACERFRQARGQWPERLSEIPKEILAEVPIDPFTGTPLTYRRLPDGIAIYSAGDIDANTARRQVENNDPMAGLGIGWRLWDPAARRQPPRAAREVPEKLP
jgi:hypothetical protein